MSVRRSGLQRQVLDLYRQYMRVLQQKPQESRASLYALVRKEFDKHKTIPPKVAEFDLIEHHLRTGRRKLGVISSSGTVGASSVRISGTPK